MRALDAMQDIEKARDIVQSAGREFQRISRECQINRLVEATQKQYRNFAANYDRMLADLQSAATPDNPFAVPVTFPMTQARMVNVQNPLNGSRWADVNVIRLADSDLVQLENTLKKLRDLHGEAQSLDKLRREARRLLDDQKRIREQILAWQKDDGDRNNLKHPTIRETGSVSLAKGDTKRVSHAIQWNQYEGDTMVLKLASSDPSIIVPAQITLDFEKNQFRFDYEVKSGTKEGTFKIKLTPATGPPVEVQVIVK